MRLIGMLDSPYVRRVAVSLKIMGIPFSHESVSLFSQYKAFEAINPVVRAPTLVTDGGATLMESTLILDYLEHLVADDRRLTPIALDDYVRSQRLIGLALAACDKAVQMVYEFNLRPTEKQHQPWIDRVGKQLLAALDLLEKEIGSCEKWIFNARPLQADISVAVAWRFIQSVLSDVVVKEKFPGLSAFSQRAEALPEFASLPLK